MFVVKRVHGIAVTTRVLPVPRIVPCCSCRPRNTNPRLHAPVLPIPNPVLITSLPRSRSLVRPLATSATASSTSSSTSTSTNYSHHDSSSASASDSSESSAGLFGARGPLTPEAHAHELEMELKKIRSKLQAMAVRRYHKELAWRSSEAGYLSSRAELLASGGDSSALDGRYRKRELVRMKYWDKRQALVAAYEARCSQLVKQLVDTGVQSYVSRYSLLQQHRFGIQTLLSSVLSPHTQQAERVSYDVYDVSTRSPLCDFIVVIQANTPRQVSFLASHIYKSARSLNACARNPRTLSLSGSASDGWMFIDIGEIMVHVFTPDKRQESQLELSTLFQQTKVPPAGYPLLTDVVWRSGSTVLSHPTTSLRPRPRLEKGPDGSIRVVETETETETDMDMDTDNNAQDTNTHISSYNSDSNSPRVEAT